MDADAEHTSYRQYTPTKKGCMSYVHSADNRMFTFIQ